MNRTLAIRLTLLAAIAGLAMIYGMFAQAKSLFPSPQLLKAKAFIAEKLLHHAPAPDGWFYSKARDPKVFVTHDARAMAPGLTLIDGIGPDESVFVRLVDTHGQALQTWSLDWQRLWPDHDFLPADERPIWKNGRLRGVVSLGAVVDDKAALTFNFEQLGMMQLDICGRVNWKVARQTHHSMFRDEDGNYWTPSLSPGLASPDLPNYKPRFGEYFVLEVSPRGKILREISIHKLLAKNGYNGLLYMMAPKQWTTEVSGDTVHVTSVSVFPRSMKAGRFSPGDVLLVLGKISTVIVFDPKTLVIKASLTGRALRANDANFSGGDTVSQFDNRNITSDETKESSRILEHNFRTDEDRTVFEGSPANPFYTLILGRHQRLPNGNMLLTEALKGRVIEIDRKGRLLWEYFNIVGPDTLGVIAGAERIPPTVLTAEKLKALKAACPSTLDDNAKTISNPL